MLDARVDNCGLLARRCQRQAVTATECQSLKSKRTTDNRLAILPTHRHNNLAVAEFAWMFWMVVRVSLEHGAKQPLLPIVKLERLVSLRRHPAQLDQVNEPVTIGREVNR